MAAVTLEYRNIELGNAELDEEGSPTLHMAYPLPVRTLVGVRGAKGVRGFEVERVIEVVRGEGETTRCVGRWTDADLDAHAAAIGSENLEPSQAAVDAANEAAAAEQAAAQATPEPEAIDVSAASPAPEPAPEPAEAAAEEAEAAAAEGETAAAASEPEADAEQGATDGGGASKMKKRKGRRRG